MKKSCRVYVRHLNSSVERPQIELKGFARIPLQAGEKRVVQMTLPAERLAYWNVRSHRV
mgnify:CR=1 FL=1